MDGLLYEKESFELRGLFFRVHNELRPGWKEEIYHQRLLEEALKAGLPVRSKPRHTLYHRGQRAYTLEPDLVFWDQIVVELKALPFTQFGTVDAAQLINYLKLLQHELGLWVNFGPTKLYTKRHVLTPQPVQIAHNEAHAHAIELNYQTQLREISAKLAKMVEKLGLGYTTNIFHALVNIELDYLGYQTKPEVDVPNPLGEPERAQTAYNHILVNNCFLIQTNALLNHPSRFHFAQMKTFLQALNLPAGIVLNFGKRTFQTFFVSS